LERLGRVLRHIAEGKVRITRQKALIERLVAKDHDVRLAEGTLHNLIETQEIFELYRQTILNAVDRNRAMDLDEPTGCPYPQCQDHRDWQRLVGVANAPKSPPRSPAALGGRT